MIKTERDLWKLLKKSSAGILFDRIENWAVLGVPDLLGYNKNKTFFTLELKLSKANKIRFSPHQVAWHLRHGPGAFILVARPVNRDKNTTVNIVNIQQRSKWVSPGGLRAGGPTHFFLYESRQIMELVARGLKIKPIVGGLSIDEIIKYLNGLGALAPRP
tara:strand:+ start:192 stop:671 length:480 start_codon:yes stop_codon:yes gene_type:complete